MFAYIKGRLMEASASAVIIETSGLGYKISVPATVFAQLPQISHEIQLHLSFVVREQSHTLYGFLQVQEKDLFEILMGVTGIGPKLALAIIGHLSLHALYQALQQGDVSILSKVPGIGKKTAARMIIELKDSVSAMLPSATQLSIPFPPHDPAVQKIQDAMSALIHLGYNQATAQKAVKKTLTENTETIALADLITLSLKNV
jgi:Holliday junction DNA helicase RuvA